METKLLIPKTDENAIRKAALLIKNGEIVGIPTETVYGLGANALNGEAVKKIFKAKGRPQDNPLIVHISSFKEIYPLVSTVPKEAIKLAQLFWPGPLTMVLPKSDIIPEEVSAGLTSVGIRMPSHPIAREIIKEAGVPIAAPSANLSGKPSTTTAQHVLEDLSGKISAVVEGGKCSVGVESTVISLAVTPPRLLRPGGISLEQLRSALGEVEVDNALFETLGEGEQVSSPGMKYRHYAPKAKVTVICGEPYKTAEYIKNNANKTSGILCFDEFKSFFNTDTIITFGKSDNDLSQAQEVFDALRHFDNTSVSEIFAQCPSSRGIGLAVSNRLKKAAGFNVINLAKPKIIGLAGSSGTGKGTICSIFKDLGIPSVDADKLYHNLLQQDETLIASLKNTFGNEIFDQNGVFNRKKLGKIVFNNEKALKTLSDITTPIIRKASQQAFNELSDKGFDIILYDAPTLFETGANNICDKVIAVIAPFDKKVKRICARDGISEEYAKSRLSVQKKDSFYTEKADFIINNDQDFTTLEKNVINIYNELIKKE